MTILLYLLFFETKLIITLFYNKKTSWKPLKDETRYSNIYHILIERLTMTWSRGLHSLMYWPVLCTPSKKKFYHLLTVSSWHYGFSSVCVLLVLLVGCIEGLPWKVGCQTGLYWVRLVPPKVSTPPSLVSSPDVSIDLERRTTCVFLPPCTLHRILYRHYQEKSETGALIEHLHILLSCTSDRPLSWTLWDSFYL